MFCMNNLDINGKPLDKHLYGPDDAFDHRHIEIMFKPCVPTSTPKLLITEIPSENQGEKKNDSVS